MKYVREYCQGNERDVQEWKRSDHVLLALNVVLLLVLRVVFVIPSWHSRRFPRIYFWERKAIRAHRQRAVQNTKTKQLNSEKEREI